MTASAPDFDPTATAPGAAGLPHEDTGRLGIPHILGRRARWMTARLRPSSRT